MKGGRRKGVRLAARGRPMEVKKHERNQQRGGAADVRKRGEKREEKPERRMKERMKTE